MNLDLAALGFTKEELQNRVIDQLVHTILNDESEDEDGNVYLRGSGFKREIDARIVKHVDATINALADKYVLPNVAQYVENLTLQKTNEWGEKRGGSITFIEYLTQRAEAYMQEKVNFEGKSKEEAGAYSWNGSQTRITHLVEKHLHYSIENAMKDALRVATGEIAKGIHETARIKLNEIAASMKVEVKTK